MTKRFYGFEHRYGSHMRDDDGDLIGTLHVFHGRLARDRWVADGPLCLSEPGTRTEVSPSYAAKWERMSSSVLQDDDEGE